jgi:hypothetical protein
MPKLFACIIQGAIAGAISLTGLNVLVSLLVLAYGHQIPWANSLIFISKWTMTGIYTSFAVSACLGAFVGSLIGKKYPTKTTMWCSSVAAPGVILTFGLWWVYVSANKVESFHTMKLTDCTNNPVLMNFKVPRGFAYRLFLVTPELESSRKDSTALQYKFAAYIRVVCDSVPVSAFSINPNELESEGLTSFGIPLTGGEFYHTNLPVLAQIVKPQQNVSIEITFDPPPPPPSSVWLDWLQSGKDQRK